MSKYVIEVLKDYDIIHNLGYFTIDNAPNKDTMITTLSLALWRDFNLKYEPVYYCIHYQGHVINLAIKSFLFVTNKEALNEDEERSVYNITIEEIEE